MEDTCRGENCWFYVLIRELSDTNPNLTDCPFYQEMIFTPQAIGEKVETAKLVKDCANKRGLLVLLEMVYPRLLGVQKANEEQRNSSDQAMSLFNRFLTVAASRAALKSNKADPHDHEGPLEITG